MAISGAGGWIPSNRVKLQDGDLFFTAMTQNKPKDVLCQDANEAARRLLAGEVVTMDIRYEFTTAVKEAMKAL